MEVLGGSTRAAHCRRQKDSVDVRFCSAVSPPDTVCVLKSICALACAVKQRGDRRQRSGTGSRVHPRNDSRWCEQRHPELLR